jgi:hypothetical protein
MGNENKTSVVKPERKRPRHRWEDNIKMDIEGIVFEGVDWIHMTEDGVKSCDLVNRIINIPVP